MNPTALRHRIVAPVAVASLVITSWPVFADELPVAPDAAAARVVNSIRYVERPDGRSELQTAIISTVNPSGARVDLVSVVHIGDQTYFEAMNQILATYDVVLYELVGGPMETRDQTAAPTELDATRLLQRVVQSMLGLRYQLEGIRYDRPNFVHSDATWEDWDRLTKERDQNMTTLFTRAMQMQNDPGMKEEIEKMGSEEMFTELLAAVREFNPDRFKRSLAPMLSESEAFITRIEGEDGTVVITERNKIVMQGVEDQLAKGHRKIAVFYGAGHMPDLVNRLKTIGFAEAESQWISAWNIGNDAKTVSGLNLLESVLKDDAVVEGFISMFRSFLGEAPESPDIR